MTTNRTKSIAASIALVALASLSVAAQADSCSQAKSDIKQIWQHPIDSYHNSDRISNAVGNAYNCITNNPTTVQEERGDSSSTYDSNDASSSSSSDDSGSDDGN